MSFGVTEDGFRRKTYPEIRDDMLEDAREIFGPDWNLGRDSVIGLVIRSVAFAIAQVWAVLGVIYNNPFVRYASGKSLDLVVDYTGIDRRAARKSEGMVTITGDANTVIPAGTRVGQTDDADFPRFRTDNEVEIQSDGDVDAFVTAVKAGAEGDIGAGAIENLINPIAGVDSVNNNKDTATLTVGDDANTTTAKTVSIQQSNTYQVVDVSDIKHEIFLTGFTLRVENTSGQEENYRIRFRLLDDSDGSEIVNLGNQVYTLSAGVQDITFDGFEANVREADKVRVEIFLKADSDSALDVIVDTDSANNYQNGDFYLGGTQQTDEDLVLDVTSETLGDFRRGRDRETDQELRDRYFASLARGGSSTLAAIQSGLTTVADVEEVLLEENVTDSTSGGLPPHSFRATVQGGTNQDIGKKIVDEKPAGIQDAGSVAVTVEDELGNTRSVNFERPNEITIDFNVVVDTDVTFPADGDKKIKSAIINYVGGTDVDGETVSGRSIGEDVIQSKAVAEVADVQGVTDVTTLELAKSGNTLDSANVTIAADEVSQTTQSDISLTVN